MIIRVACECVEAGVMDKILFLISAPQVKVIRYTRRNAKKWRPSLSEFETFSLRTTDAVTSSLDHGSQVPTTEGLEKCCLVVERGHRSRESREGDLEHRASQGCLWYRQHSSYNVQGSFPPLLLLSVPNSHVSRTQRLTDWISSSLGYTAPISAERLTGV